MSKPFVIATTKRKPAEPASTADIAARHLVYKLFDATNGRAGAWHILGDIGERPETVAKAVERGWVIVRLGNGASRKMAQSAALTDAGRLAARKGLRG